MEHSNHPPFVTDLVITYEFITGTGPQKRNFGPQHLSNVSLQNSHLTKVALVKIKKMINQGKMKDIAKVGFNPLEKEDSGPFSQAWDDKTKYNTTQFVGSADFKYKIAGNQVNITVTNETSLYSALYHIPFIGKPSRSETPLGIGGNVEQAYTFSVPLDQLK